VETREESERQEKKRKERRKEKVFIGGKRGRRE